MTRKRAAALFSLLCLAVPATAHGNGDPASHVLLVERAFLPLEAEVDSGAAERLGALLEAADESGFPIRVALIAKPVDLGTAYSLYLKPQQYAEFLGKELSFSYSDRLLIVMPNGFGYALNSEPDRQAAQALAGLAAPGRNATKQTNAATVAVRRLARQAGRTIAVPESASETRDRIVIAASALLGLAVLAALVLYHRKSRTLSP